MKECIPSYGSLFDSGLSLVISCSTLSLTCQSLLNSSLKGRFGPLTDAQKLSLKRIINRVDTHLQTMQTQLLSWSTPLAREAVLRSLEGERTWSVRGSSRSKTGRARNNTRARRE